MVFVPYVAECSHLFRCSHTLKAVHLSTILNTLHRHSRHSVRNSSQGPVVSYTFSAVRSQFLNVAFAWSLKVYFCLKINHKFVPVLKHRSMKVSGDVKILVNSFLPLLLNGGEWWGSRSGRFTTKEGILVSHGREIDLPLSRIKTRSPSP
jgi:hypothetical protein